VNGVSNHGGGRAENDVKKSPHGVVVERILDVGF
jgi:hypothetical protein